MEKRWLILFILLTSVSFNALAFDGHPERRQSQNPTTPAYFVIPLPYSKPGIGDGFLLLGNVANVAGTTADISLVQITGDAGGTIINGEEVPLISDWLNLEFQYMDISRANINNYSIRGMNGTKKNDFNIVEIGFSKQLDATLVFNFFDKQFNFYYMYSDGDFRVDALKDNNGALIQALNYESSDNQQQFKFEVDFTDDFLDPRNGLRFGLTYQNHSPDDANDVDFYTLDYSALAYVPIRENDTLVLNYRQSDAHVNRIGNIDPTIIRAELTTNCSIGDTSCLIAEQELVDSFINERSFGTASDLGGDQRLRSYPQSRFNGAHSAFIGAEYRWNLRSEATPFDYYFWKDVRTGIQVAFYAEAGSVAESSSQLWDESRFSVGTGLRVITGSGGVYRADIASGDEGVEVIIIFDYPWF